MLGGGGVVTAFSQPKFSVRGNCKFPYNTLYFYSIWILEDKVAFEHQEFNVLQFRKKTRRKEARWCPQAARVSNLFTDAKGKSCVCSNRILSHKSLCTLTLGNAIVP